MMTDTRDQGFGAEVKRRIMLGTYALSSGFYDAFYLKASQVRTLIRRDFETAFETFDVLVSPTAPTVAFPLGAKADDPIQMYLNDICTIPVNMAGIPAISVPCGYDQGLPVGLHLMAAHWQEPKLLQVAHAYEQAAGWTRKAVEEAGRVTVAG
ncbi:MAG: Glutamyl-tRNA(Gln) amidotransferase subunit A [bacterium ADurb.Bin429]|nr:MAG: Glutamyl-tRNA(Gln) amidotransferase subunit A [bacterium ADurb.Bin429]